MTDPLDPEVALIHGLAVLLQTAGVGAYGGLTQTAPYPPSGPVITLGGLPPTRPAVALHVYDDVPIDWSTTRYFVQARIRTTGSPTDTGLVRTTRDALHGRRHPPMPPGIRVTSIQLASRAWLGLVAGAYEHTLSFSVLAARAAAWAAGAVY